MFVFIICETVLRKILLQKSETISEDGAMGVAITSQKENDNASRLPDHDVEKCRNGFLSVGNCTIQQPQGQKGQKNRRKTTTI